MKIEDKAHALLFGIQRSSRYHARRRGFFDRYNLFTNAVSVIFGSAAIYAMFSTLQNPKGWAAAAALTVTVFSSINLVIGSTRMARLHEDLYKRFVALERRFISAPPKDEAQYAELCYARLEIEADEPPIMKILDCMCHNDLIRAKGHPSKRMAPITTTQRLLAHVYDFREHKVRIPDEGAATTS